MQIRRDAGAGLVATCQVAAFSREGVAIAPEMRACGAVHAPRQLQIVPAVTLEMAWRLRLPARIHHRVKAGPP